MKIFIRYAYVCFYRNYLVSLVKCKRKIFERKEKINYEKKGRSFIIIVIIFEVDNR